MSKTLRMFPGDLVTGSDVAYMSKSADGGAPKIITDCVHSAVVTE